jgi:hypothetical protein
LFQALLKKQPFRLKFFFEAQMAPGWQVLSGEIGLA